MTMMTKAPLGVVRTYADPAGAPLGAAPVLVIDDEPVAAIRTQGWLGDEGYPTAAESDGDAVLRLVRAEAMRLVVSELYIPCAEGPCVVAALKTDRRRLPRLRVLAFTRHTTPTDDARALAAGCDGVLHKPASADRLVREVRRLEGAAPLEPGSVIDENRSPR